MRFAAEPMPKIQGAGGGQIQRVKMKKPDAQGIGW